MSLSAWHQFGVADQDPVQAAQDWHVANSPPAPPPRKKTR
jgi:hypothetical protein